MRCLLTILICSCLAVRSIAQEVSLSGRVVDEYDNPIPFATVKIDATRQLYLTNEEGFFSLTVDPAHLALSVKKIGFLPTSQVLDARQDLFTNFVLKHDQWRDPQGADSLDGKAIIAKVIQAKRSRRDESYSARVYTKGLQKLESAPKKLVGRQVADILRVDSSRRGILYQTETLSELYHHGSQRKELLISQQSAGAHEGLSFERASDLDFSLYDEMVHWNAFGRQSFISPLADNASKYYTYRLAGVGTVGGKLVYRVELRAKRKFDPVFSGDLYIVEGDWQLYYAKLELSRGAHLNFIDSVKIDQGFEEVFPGKWLPEKAIIVTRSNLLGFSFSGYYGAAYNDFKEAPTPGNFFASNEVLREAPDADRKRESYWTSNRWIALTAEAHKQYQIRDSVSHEARKKLLNDSLQQQKNRFKPVQFFIAGYRWNDEQTRNSWYISSLKNTGFYNAVEGWGFRLHAGYAKQFNLRQELEVSHNFRYGFGNRKLNSNVQIAFRYDTIRHASIVLRAGTDFLDLNSRGTLNLFYNSITNLIGGRNYLQLYRSKFISLYTQRELADGLILSTGAEIARRSPTFNRFYAPLFQSAERMFTDHPVGEVDRSLFPVNNAFTFETTTSYTFAQKYSLRPDGKVYEAPNYPTVKLRYRKGISQVFGSAVNYDFFSADVFQDKIRVGLKGFSSFYVSAGKFLNANSLFFPDIHHFTGNQTAYSNPIFPNFHFLDYYAYSTREKYLEAHYEHNFSGLIASRIPLLGKLKLEEIVGGAYLGQPNATYKEFYVGFQRLMFRADYGIYWQTNRKMQHGFRFFYGF